jgi:hypothetical protein
MTEEYLNEILGNPKSATKLKLDENRLNKLVYSKAKAERII